MKINYGNLCLVITLHLLCVYCISINIFTHYDAKLASSSHLPKYFFISALAFISCLFYQHLGTSINRRLSLRRLTPQSFITKSHINNHFQKIKVKPSISLNPNNL
jgi:uncharacterized membrane protein YcfT